jgi:SAM-dependent methyltransferase
MDRGIEWTGERCVPWAPAAEVVYEHFHRYYLAAEFVTGMTVLDLACGEGYGTRILASRAGSVTGIDIDLPTIVHAKRNYADDRVSFLAWDMLELDALGHERFDAVVCFEAIEHVEDHEAVMAGIRGLLKPSGLLIMSTPEEPAYHEANPVENPYHVKELSAAEFELLLGRSFANVVVHGQAVCAGSVILGPGQPDGGGRSVLVPFSRQEGAWVTAFSHRPTYLIGLASDGPLPSLPSASVLLDDRAELLTEAWGASRSASLALERSSERAERAEADVQRLTTELACQKEQAFAQFEVSEVRRRALQEQLDTERALVSDLYQELSRTRTSFPMRTWRVYEAARDRLLPPGSRLRDIYDLAARAMLRAR